jgi:hypothetical protein
MEIWIKNAGKYLPFISGSRFPVTLFPVTSGDSTSGDVISDRACAHDHFRHHHTAAAASAAIALTFHPKHEKRKQKTLAKRTNSH